ncbi:MAG: hypothetical protein AAF721_40650 [Myxococcota bacterium]
MKRNLYLLLGLGLATGCADDSGRGVAYDPAAGTAGVPTGGLDDGTGGPAPEATDDDDGPSDPDDGDPDDGDPDDGDPDDGDPDDGGDTEGEIPIDCSPGWATPWIGSPCESNADCSFAGGECLTDGDGFPCGTCTQSCTTTCPDTDGAPITYCINGNEVGLSNAGQCLSKCDTMVLGGEGCRDGYVCNVLSRFDGSAAAGVCIPDEFDNTDGGALVDEIDHEFLIDHLGGDPVDATQYGPDLDSFQQYLDAVGVQHTSAEEIVEPYSASAAAECGLSILLPAQDQWEKIGALALFTDDLTELVGEPIFMRNWWRPPCYNDLVGGAANGDHPDADAVDLDFQSATSRAQAQQYLCETYWDQDIVAPEQIAPGSDLDPRLNMSVGLGAVTIHLGVLSQGGRRSWKYGSYTNEPNSGTCW